MDSAVYFSFNAVVIQAASMSITSVVYLKDGVSIATAGAVDRCKKGTWNVSWDSMVNFIYKLGRCLKLFVSF